MKFITSFEIFVLCCLSMQQCFCLLATVSTVGIATKVGIASWSALSPLSALSP